MTNEILPFCPTDTGTNLLTEAEYTAATSRVSGVTAGIASSKLYNKAQRQSSFVASQIAQFVADKMNVNVLDDGVSATLLAQIKAAFNTIQPIKTVYTANATYTQSYVFTIASGSATAGATYTNNSKTFTVSNTVASGTQIIMKGTGAPTASGTLTKATGTGDATLTFYAMQAPLYLDVTVVGAGGGSGGTAATGASQAAAASGGGGGGASLKQIPITSVGASETVTVGTGGAGGAAGNNNGTAGGSSSFGAHATATGGGAGTGAPATSTNQTIAGASGGVGSSGDINMSGGSSGYARVINEAGGATAQLTGLGAGSYFAGQTLQANVAVAGNNYGGGASGASSGNSQAARAGAAGGNGVVIVVEHFQ